MTLTPSSTASHKDFGVIIPATTFNWRVIYFTPIKWCIITATPFDWHVFGLRPSLDASYQPSCSIGTLFTHTIKFKSDLDPDPKAQTITFEPRAAHEGQTNSSPRCLPATIQLNRARVPPNPLRQKKRGYIGLAPCSTLMGEAKPLSF